MEEKTSGSVREIKDGRRGSKSFTSDHLSALKDGAKRRKEEQIVGNWVRITNPVLYAKLLLESKARPTSEILENDEIETVNSKSTLKVGARQEMVPQETIVVEHKNKSETILNKPPPMIDIR